MPEFCSCGAQLPPDAVFCHKCGKPQRDIVAVEPEPQVAPPIPAILVPVEPPQVNFRNPDALKTALIGALLPSCFFFLPLVNWVAAGYFAVFFYRRHPRQSVNIIS